MSILHNTAPIYIGPNHNNWYEVQLLYEHLMNMIVKLMRFQNELQRSCVINLLWANNTTLKPIFQNDMVQMATYCMRWELSVVIFETHNSAFTRGTCVCSLQQTSFGLNTNTMWKFAQEMLLCYLINLHPHMNLKDINQGLYHYHFTRLVCLSPCLHSHSFNSGPTCAVQCPHSSYKLLNCYLLLL